MRRIEVLGVNVENKGKYRQAKVDFKDVETGKIDGKQLMSFVFKDVFKMMSEAKTGDVFDVKPVKNDKGYWDWTEAQPAGKNTGSAPSSPGMATAIARRGDFETSEERAKKQVYIARQSSLDRAVQLAVANGQKPVTEADIIRSAKVFEEYVLGIEPVVTEAEVN